MKPSAEHLAAWAPGLPGCCFYSDRLGRCGASIPEDFTRFGIRTCEPHWVVQAEQWALLREDLQAAVAYRAMLALFRPREIEYPPTRVRSWRGMVRLYAAIFGQKRPGYEYRARWSWPPHAVARAHLAQSIDPDNPEGGGPVTRTPPRLMRVA